MNNKIRELREEQGITQNDLSKATGLSIGYISLLENNIRQNPSSKTRERISLALNKEVKEIFSI